MYSQSVLAILSKVIGYASPPVARLMALPLYIGERNTAPAYGTGNAVPVLTLADSISAVRG